MGKQHSIYSDQECKQDYAQSSTDKNAIKIENYRNFFKHITSDHDLDLDVSLDADEDVQIISRSTYGR